MKNKIVVYFLIFLLGCSASLNAKQKNLGLKQQIEIELSELSKDLNTAKTQVQKLTQSNLQIKAALNEMESWGVLQQEEKEKYYNQSVLATLEISELQGSLNVQKATQEKLQNKYSRLKTFFACLCGCVMAAFCYSFSTTISSTVALVGGPQIKLISYLIPLLGFGAGYFAAYLYF